MIRIISSRSSYGRALLPLTVLFLSSCGGGSTPPPATATGTMATTSGVPGCGIEGSGVQIKDCNSSGDQTPPPPVTAGCAGGGPQSIVVDPTGQFAYVAKTDCALAYAGLVSVYAINATTGTLTSIGQPVPTQDEGAISVAVDPVGKFAYVANWGEGDTSGSVSVYTINATPGVLTFTETIQAPCGSSPGSCAPWSVAVDSSGKFVYVANEGGFSPTSISMYTISARTGVLAFMGTVTVSSGGRASSVTVDPDGKFVYLTATTDNPGSSAGEVSTYTVNASTGELTLVGSIATGIDPVAVTVDSAGKFVYVVNRDSNDVSMYTIDTTGGSLTSIGTIAAGTSPASVAVDPMSKFAYVANSGSDNVSMYSINATTGVLTSMGTVTTGVFPTSIAIDPSGKFAYVTNSGSNDVSMYSIDPAIGALALIGTVGT